MRKATSSWIFCSYIKKRHRSALGNMLSKKPQNFSFSSPIFSKVQVLIATISKGLLRTCTEINILSSKVIKAIQKLGMYKIL